MNSQDVNTLKAFVAALMRLDNSLPTDLQNQLNEIGETFPSDVSKVHALAKSYSPLGLEYKDARFVLTEGERFQFAVPEPNYPAQLSDEKIISFAIEVLNADDSVKLVNKKAQESSVLGQILFQLRRETSFMVKDTQNIPEEEVWLWQDPKAWASLERGLRQAQAGEVHYLGDFTQYADLETED